MATSLPPTNGDRTMDRFPTLSYLVLVNIFEKIAPGYLWVFGRQVCRLWRNIIEDKIGDFALGKTFLQILIRFGTTSQRTVQQIIYQCAEYDRDSEVFIFKSLPGVEPYSTSRSPGRGNNWKVLDIVPSLYPGQRRQSSQDFYLNNRPFHHGKGGFLKVWDPLGQERKNWTSVDCQKFHDMAPSEKKTGEPAQILPLDKVNLWFPNSKFGNPHVCIELEYGPYTFNCDYKTKLRYRGPWATEQTCTLVINDIRIKKDNFLRWRCGCLKRQCPADTLLTPRPYRRDRNYTPNCLLQSNSPLYQRAFVFYPEMDKDLWIKRIEKLGEPETTFFIGSKSNNTMEQGLQQIHPSRPFSCSDCIRELNNASGRCERNLCGKCCRGVSCMGHKNCLNCRSLSGRCVGITGGSCKRYHRLHSCRQFLFN
jgi:hypothetical protein